MKKKRSWTHEPLLVPADSSNVRRAIAEKVIIFLAHNLDVVGIGFDLVFVDFDEVNVEHFIHFAELPSYRGRRLPASEAVKCGVVVFRVKKIGNDEIVGFVIILIIVPFWKRFIERRSALGTVVVVVKTSWNTWVFLK